MPTLRFALSKGGPLSLEVRLEDARAPEVRLEGRALPAGPEGFLLPDGGRLTLAVDPDPRGLEPVRLFRDGKELPPLPAATEVRWAVGSLGLCGVLLAVLGAAGVTRGSELLVPHLGLTFWPALGALAFFALAAFAYRRHRLALAAGIALVCLDGVASVTRAVLLPGQVPLSPIVLRVVLLVLLSRGLAGLLELEGRRRSTRPWA